MPNYIDLSHPAPSLLNFNKFNKFIVFVKFFFNFMITVDAFKIKHQP